MPIEVSGRGRGGAYRGGGIFDALFPKRLPKKTTLELGIVWTFSTTYWSICLQHCHRIPAQYPYHIPAYYGMAYERHTACIWLGNWLAHTIGMPRHLRGNMLPYRLPNGMRHGNGVLMDSYRYFKISTPHPLLVCRSYTALVAAARTARAARPKNFSGKFSGKISG